MVAWSAVLAAGTGRGAMGSLADEDGVGVLAGRSGWLGDVGVCVVGFHMWLNFLLKDGEMRQDRISMTKRILLCPELGG
jgi:hypothetical protein